MFNKNWTMFFTSFYNSFYPIWKTIKFGLLILVYVFWPYHSNSLTFTLPSARASPSRFYLSLICTPLVIARCHSSPFVAPYPPLSLSFVHLVVVWSRTRKGYGATTDAKVGGCGEHDSVDGHGSSDFLRWLVDAVVTGDLFFLIQIWD